MSRDKVLTHHWVIDTKALLFAGAKIIRDIQSKHGETDQVTADKIGISKGTLRGIRDETRVMSFLTATRIRAVYGKESLRPWAALFSFEDEAQEPELLPLMADAITAVSRAKGPKGELDALPAVKDLAEGAVAWIGAVERNHRLRAVS
jgi:hypothetical protein